MKTTSHSLTPSRRAALSHDSKGEKRIRNHVLIVPPLGDRGQDAGEGTHLRDAHQLTNRGRGGGSSPGPATVRQLASLNGRRPGPTYVLMRTRQASPLKKPKTVQSDIEPNPVTLTTYIQEARRQSPSKDTATALLVGPRGKA